MSHDGRFYFDRAISTFARLEISLSCVTATTFAIAAATDSDLALIVTEPTVSGIHDLERALEMTSHFRVPTQVCVNKGDLHPQGREMIEDRCRELGLRTLDWIPFDQTVTEAMIAGKPVTEFQPESPASQVLARVWGDLKEVLGNGQASAK